jgi:hypothetical protein
VVYEVRKVDTLALPDEVLRSAEDILESSVGMRWPSLTGFMTVTNGRPALIVQSLED